MKISATPVLRPPHLLFEQFLLVGDLGRLDDGVLAKLLAQHSRPAKLNPYLIHQRAQSSAVGLELRFERARGHPVAALDIVDGRGDLLVGDEHVPSLHFLQPQPLVDQLAGDLRPQTVDDVGRHAHSGGLGEQSTAAADIAVADDVAVDDGDDASFGYRLRRLNSGAGR